MSREKVTSATPPTTRGCGPRAEPTRPPAGATETGERAQRTPSRTSATGALLNEPRCLLQGNSAPEGRASTCPRRPVVSTCPVGPIRGKERPPWASFVQLQCLARRTSPIRGSGRWHETVIQIAPPRRALKLLRPDSSRPEQLTVSGPVGPNLRRVSTWVGRTQRRYERRRQELVQMCSRQSCSSLAYAGYSGITAAKQRILGPGLRGWLAAATQPRRPAGVFGPRGTHSATASAAC